MRQIIFLKKSNDIKVLLNLLGFENLTGLNSAKPIQIIFIWKFENLLYLLKKEMERIINLHIEKLPEGFYLATSDSLQGLVAQGRTIAETIEIARDIAKKLIEAQDNFHDIIFEPITDSFDHPIIVGL